ncbi:hypothetical protein [Halococcus agarilyticus]|uniref:hypothetical protein n=1 Tax=Halococcus agarilyticus TaxID=1232219 RepID=UPI000677B7CD|nr:hypothetical protein [Halococcus agarilyticus]
MTKVKVEYLDKFAELSPRLDKSDADSDPSTVVETALREGIATHSAEEMNEQSDIEAKQADLAERVFSGDSGGSNDRKESMDGYARHSATGSTERVTSSESEQLSEEEKSEVEKIQSDLAERIFSG